MLQGKSIIIMEYFQALILKQIKIKKRKYVNIKIDPNDKNLIIDGSSYKGKADKDIIIGTWWNHEIVQKKAQISAVSGRIIEQKVEFIGKEDIKIGDKIYKTLRFNFSSSDPSLSKDKKLNTDIWYEENTFLWVKAAFDKTGYWEYRLKKCKIIFLTLYFMALVNSKKQFFLTFLDPKKKNYMYCQKVHFEVLLLKI